MGQNVSGSANSSSKFQQTPTGALAGIPYDTPNKVCKATWNNGTAAEQINLLCRKTLALAAAAQTINLYDGSLLDPFGNACAFRRIRRIRWRNADQTDGHTVAVSGGASTPWTGIINSAGVLTCYPSSANADGWTEFTAPNTNGIAVTSGSNTLKFDPGSNTFNVELEIDGVDA